MNDMYKTKSIVGARLVEYITHKGMSINSFEIEWGVSKNYIKNIVRNIKPEYLESLIEKWPDINLNWLIMGKGNMLNESKSDSDIPDRKHSDWESRMSTAEKKYKKTFSKFEDEVDKDLVDYERSRSTKDKNKALNKVSNTTFRAIDAADRHIRRHPKQYKESAFSNIEMI